MICKHKCPESGAPVAKRNVVRSGYRIDAQKFSCDACQADLRANWTRGTVLGMIVLLPAGPLFNIFDISTVAGFLTYLATVFLLILPLAAVVGVCAVSIDRCDKR